MELLSTIPQLDILNKESKFAGHVALRVTGITGLTSQNLQSILYERERVYCDYAARYDLLRFGVGSLFTSHIDVHTLFEKIKHVVDEFTQINSNTLNAKL